LRGDGFEGGVGYLENERLGEWVDGFSGGFSVGGGDAMEVLTMRWM